MSRRDKLVERMRSAPRSIRFGQVAALLNHEGFILFNREAVIAVPPRRRSGSHRGPVMGQRRATRTKLSKDPGSSGPLMTTTHAYETSCSRSDTGRRTRRTRSIFRTCLTASRAGTPSRCIRQRCEALDLIWKAFRNWDCLARPQPAGGRNHLPRARPKPRTLAISRTWCRVFGSLSPCGRGLGRGVIRHGRKPRTPHPGPLPQGERGTERVL